MQTSVANAAGKPFYHPELDVLRFVAFLLVFIAHSSTESINVHLFPPGVLSVIASAFAGAGFSGLALFFTLSSYLITALLLQEGDRTGTVHLRAFYTRRILRIWPLYFFFLLLVRPLATHMLPFEHFTLRDVAWFSLLAGNWLCYLHGFPPSVATPLWSISVEEQFYILWPLLVSRFRRHVPALALAMLLVANVARAALVLYPRPDPAMWCSTLTRLDPFALGALLAFYTHARELRLSATMRLLMIALAVLMLLYVGLSGAHEGPLALLFYPMESLACSLALLATLLPLGAWSPGVIGRALVYLGRISYGLYVYHLLVLERVDRMLSLNFYQHEALAFAGTVLIAAASYAGLERPFLKLKQRFTYIRSRL